MPYIVPNIVLTPEAQDVYLAKLAIRHFHNTKIKVERTGSSKTEAGRFIREGVRTIEINAVIQPVHPGDKILQQNPEWARIEGAQILHTTVPIYTTDSKGTYENQPFSDVVHWQGEKWKALSVDRLFEGAQIWRALIGRWEDKDGELEASGGGVQWLE